MTEVTALQQRSDYGPCFGERGGLNQIGLKVQCHICGKAFHHLGAHVARTHELTANGYCDEFGLKRTTGLISPALAEKRRRQCVFPSRSPEERAATSLAARLARVSTTRPVGASLEERRMPGYHERRAHALAAAREAVRNARGNGTYLERGFPSPKENSAYGRVVRRKRDVADPTRVERWRQKLAAAHFIPVERNCIICGKAFTTGVTKGRRKTCGDPCLDEYRRRKVADLQTDAARAKSAETSKRCVITRDVNGRIVSWVQL